MESGVEPQSGDGHDILREVDREDSLTHGRGNGSDSDTSDDSDDERDCIGGHAPPEFNEIVYTDLSNNMYTRTCLDKLVEEKNRCEKESAIVKCKYNQCRGAYEKLKKKFEDANSKANKERMDLEAKLDKLRKIVRGDKNKLSDLTAKKLKSYIHDEEFQRVKYVSKEQMGMKDDILDRSVGHLQLDKEYEMPLYQEHMRTIILQGLNEGRQHATKRLQLAVKGEFSLMV